MRTIDGQNELRQAQNFGRTERRRAVVLTWAGYAGLCGFTLLYTLVPFGLFEGAGLRIYQLAVGLGILASSAAVGGGVVGVFGSEQSYANKRDERLDERQRAVRDRAYRRAYRVLAVAGVLLVGYLLAAIWFEGALWLPDTFGEVYAVVVGFTAFAFTLPGAIIAWTEPDPPDPDPDVAVEPEDVEG